MSSTRKLLQDIANSQDFERLLVFREAQTWNTLTDDERELLATLFTSLGERELASGDANAMRSFETATKIAPGSFAVWYHWGMAQMRLGLLSQDSDHFKCADHCFLTAQSLVNSDSDKGRLFWRWGLCWGAMGKMSGEAPDYHCGIEKFRVAEVACAHEAAFWIDYGFLVRELGILVQRPAVWYQAMELFVKASKMKPDESDAWSGIALIAQRLYQWTRERAYFHESDRAFRMVASLGTLAPDQWLAWAHLMLDRGKYDRDIEILRQALERFEKANSGSDLDPRTILPGWGEAQILIGGELERLDLIQAGLEKCKRCLTLLPDHPRLLALQSTALVEMGLYFSDERYFERAIEGLKQAMTLRHDDPVLWHGFFQAHYALGEARRDPTLVARAAHSCAQAIEHGDHNPQIYNDWGVALMRLSELTHEKKQIELAIEKFEQAIAYQIRGQDPIAADRGGIDPEWLYNYGCALDFLGEFTHESKYHEKAIQVLSQVIILDAHFSHARYNLALAFYHLGELVNDLECYHKALELFQSVVEQDPEDEAAWVDWGVTLISLSQLMRDPVRPDIPLGLLEQAEMKLHHAAALGNINAYYHLACVYSLSGHPSAAIDYLERAATSDSLPPLEEIFHDEWLEELQHNPKFREWVNQLGRKPHDLQ